MRHVFKYGLVIIVYAVLIVVVDLTMGIGMKDQWEKLILWSRK